MGTIKLEFDIPEFEKELKVEIILRKDGEVVYSASSPSTGTIDDEKKLPKEEKLVDRPKKEKATSEETDTQKVNVKSPAKKKKFGGNMMDLEI